MKSEKYNTVGTVSKSNKKNLIETGAKSIPLAYKYLIAPFSGLVQAL